MISNYTYGRGHTLRIAFGIIVLALLMIMGANAATITVNASFGADYTKIQDAINDATVGDIIEVDSGTYYENLNVNKHLILRGIGMPAVDAERRGSPITLAVDGITLEGFTAKGAGLYQAGIKVISNDNKLIGNNVNSNEFVGILLSDFSSNNTLISNNVLNNGYGIILSESSDNMLIGNNVNSNHGFNDLGQQIVGNGISLYSSSNNKMISNNVLNNDNGIILSESSDNMLIGNNANSNYGFNDLGQIVGNGISLYSSNDNTLIGNNVSNNGIGIDIFTSSNNRIYNNNFINNPTQVSVYDDNNIFNLAAPTGGNYWNNYDTPEKGCNNNNGDSFCDLPYGQDNLPWTVQNGWPNLRNTTYATTYINWIWRDSSELAFDHVEVYIDNNFMDNVPKGIQFYNATGFDPYTEHTIAIRTVDVNGNVNQTWMNHTARTAHLPPPIPGLLFSDDFEDNDLSDWTAGGYLGKDWTTKPTVSGGRILDPVSGSHPYGSAMHRDITLGSIFRINTSSFAPLVGGGSSRIGIALYSDYTKGSEDGYMFELTSWDSRHSVRKITNGVISETVLSGFYGDQANDGGPWRIERNATGYWTVYSNRISTSGGMDMEYSNFNVIEVFIWDESGHQANIGDIYVYDFTTPLDTTPPVIDCGSVDGLWHGADVSIACTARDKSGLANSEDASFSLSTNVANGEETISAVTNSHDVCDLAGNCATAGPITGNMVDKKAPSISILAPITAGKNMLYQAIAASYSCSDGGSGIDTCNGPVPDDIYFDTNTVGSKSFTVNANDLVGNTASATNNYNVIYNFNGFFRPIENLDSNNNLILNAVKAGSAIPAKFSLNGNQGFGIIAADFPKSSLTICDSNAIVDPVNETVTAGSSSLSYDVTADQYIYVWKTDKAWSNTCRQLNVKLIDGTMHVANFKFT